MTREQLITKVRQNLNDWAITYYNVDDLNDSIQDAYDEIVIISECIEKIIDIPVELILTAPGAGQPWINFRAFLQDYYRPLAILNRTSREFLFVENDRDNDAFMIDWQLKNNGRVSSFIINGPDWLGFPNGYFDRAHKDLRLFYKAAAPTIDLTIPNYKFKILNEYQKLLELYVTADLLEQNQEFEKAAGYWTDYESILEEYRKKVMLLSKADRIFTRSLNWS